MRCLLGPPPRRAIRNRVQGDLGLCSWIELVAEIGGGRAMHRASGAAQGTPAMARRSGAWKRVTFDEAAGGDGPGTSSPGGESNPINPGAGSATESVRGRVTTSLPVDNTGNKERCSEGSRSRAHRSDHAEIPGKPGTIANPC